MLNRISRNISNYVNRVSLEIILLTAIASFGISCQKHDQYYPLASPTTGHQSTEHPDQRKAEYKNKHGLIISGTPIDPHLEKSQRGIVYALFFAQNLDKAYTAFTNHFGIKPENISTYTSTGTICEISDLKVDGVSTTQNIQKYFESKKISKDDFLFIYLSCHDIERVVNDDGQEEYMLGFSPGKHYMSTLELKECLEQTSPKLGLIFINVCNAGKHGRTLRSERYFIITSSDQEWTWDVIFSNRLFDSLAGFPDSNNDGLLSIGELYRDITVDSPLVSLGKRPLLIYDHNLDPNHAYLPLVESNNPK